MGFVRESVLGRPGKASWLRNRFSPSGEKRSGTGRGQGNRGRHADCIGKTPLSCNAQV